MLSNRVLRKRGKVSGHDDGKSQELRPKRKAVLTDSGDENDKNVLNQSRSRSKRLKLEVKDNATQDQPTNDVKSHEDSQDEEIDYEEKRKQNIQANADFLTSIGLLEERINMIRWVTKPCCLAKVKNMTKTYLFEMLEVQAKVHLGLVTENQKKPTKRGLREWKPKEREILPRRSSLRIRNMDPDGQELPSRPEVKPLFEEDVHERKSAEPIPFAECWRNKDQEHSDCHQKFLTSLKRLRTAITEPGKQATDTEKFVSSLGKMKITAEQVAKVVPQRIFSVAVHPTETKVLACVGDKWGRIGIWDVESQSGQDGVFCYEPQSRPIYEMRIPKHDHNKLYSSSYDGTLKCADFQSSVFTQVFATPEDEDLRLNGFDFTSASTVVVGLNGGKIAVVDFRTDGSRAEVDYRVDRFSVKGISVHPTQPHYFLTAAKSGMVCLWDSRKLNENNNKPKPLQELPHPKSIDGAVFSPLTGNNIVTICMDDKIRLYDSADLADIKLRYSISHNNHTGRWLSNFRPEWHPARDDLFVVGSMKHPRQIELFNTQGKLVRTFTDGQENLASVCSLNAFHQTKNILVGGNSSGRVHVFKD